VPDLRQNVSDGTISDLPQLIGNTAQGRSSRRGGPATTVRTAQDRILTTPGYAYLKIAEGCSRRCGYCTIPSIRGPLRSVPTEVLEDEARCLADAGAREIVLVAQDLTAYGRDWSRKNALLPLLDRLHRVDGIQWIRLMYVHPAGIPVGLASLINESDRVLPYLDIPFQHVSDAVLHAMKRPSTGDRIRKLVDRLRKEIRGLVLRTTFIDRKSVV